MGPNSVAWTVEEVAVVGAINYDEMQWRRKFWPVYNLAIGVRGLRWMAGAPKVSGTPPVKPGSPQYLHPPPAA